MNNNLTEIVCIIDRSGSMQRIKDDAIGGFNAFVEAQKSVAGDAQLTLVLFNHEYNQLYSGAKLEDVALDDQTFVPAGTTALYDAIGRTIDDIGTRLAKSAEDDRPGQVIVAILTDGLENASRDYNQSRIAQMIEHQQSKYSWEFIFLAANQDAFETGGKLKMRRDNISNFEASSDGIHASMHFASRRVASLREKKRPTKDSKL